MNVGIDFINLQMKEGVVKLVKQQKLKRRQDEKRKERIFERANWTCRY